MRAPLFIAVCTLFFISNAYGYTVVGNKIKDPNGDEVLLRGINRPSLEWALVGEQLSLADYGLMKGWGANVIRVCLNQDSWLSTPSYKTTVQQQASWITGNLDIGVIFDLHWNNGGQQNMADLNSVTFWTQMADTFKDNPWVMFELYNEPHDVDWNTWKNGGGNYAGMQQLYNAVRTKATNLVIVNGLNWAYDLSGVGSGYAITGTNIAYATHPYDYGGKQEGDWPSGFGFLVANYPVIMTEFGQYCNTDTYVADLLAYAQRNGIHWVAWAWFVNGCSFPSIISDWAGTPAPIVGVLVKQYLGGSGTISIPTTGAGTTATATATTGPPPPSNTPLTIYTDSLQNGFQSWSWGSTANFAYTTLKHSGSNSIQLPSGESGAIYFHTDSYFYLGAYSSFDFYVYPDNSAAASNINIILYGTTNNNQLTTKSVTASAGTWNHVNVQTSQFGISLSSQLSGVAIQLNIAATGQGNIYVDDVSFFAGTGTTSTAATTTTTTTTTTTSTSTTAKATTTTTSTTAKATTTTTTAKPTTTTTTTAKPTTTTTTTTAKSTTTTSTTGSSSCGASSISVTQTPGSTWTVDGAPVTQYAVTIASSCTSKTLSAVSFTLTNWDIIGVWNFDVTGTTGSIPSYSTITPASPYSFGYQNKNGPATFTVLSYTFQ